MRRTNLRVVSPVGEKISAPAVPLAPRPETLEGKTVCEIWNAGFMGEAVFPIVEELLRERYPGIKIIPYAEFPLVGIGSLGPATRAKTLETVRVTLAQKGCDAVITGMG